MDNYFYPTISEEVFAAWLDGTLSAEDESLFLETCANNKDIQELLDANDQVDESFENMVENGYELPDEFQTDFDIPEIYDNSDDDIEEYGDDDVESYDDYQEDDDEDDSGIDDETFNSQTETDVNEDYNQNDYDIL